MSYEVEYINGNTLDNRRENLKLVETADGKRGWKEPWMAETLAAYILKEMGVLPCN